VADKSRLLQKKMTDKPLINNGHYRQSWIGEDISMAAAPSAIDN
jgi:hypothetical protein